MEDAATSSSRDMTGTLFDTGMNSPDKPVQIGTITIDGTLLHIAVYPTRVSRRGRLVNDVKLHYPPVESGRLVRLADVDTE